MWLNLRAQGVPISSTWIDQANEGETEDFSMLWDQIIEDIRSSSALLFYAAHDDFPLKGAFVEVGIAMDWELPIFVVLDNVTPQGRTMRPVGSWVLHRSVQIFQTVDQALEALRSQGLIEVPA
jgi:hypothetical protein